MYDVECLSRDEFEEAFNSGRFDVKEGDAILGKADWWWVASDGHFWVEYLFQATGQRRTMRLLIVADEVN